VRASEVGEAEYAGRVGVFAAGARGWEGHACGVCCFVGKLRSPYLTYRTAELTRPIPGGSVCSDPYTGHLVPLALPPGGSSLVMPPSWGWSGQAKRCASGD
jgi:hypothetical protein